MVFDLYFKLHKYTGLGNIERLCIYSAVFQFPPSNQSRREPPVDCVSSLSDVTSALMAAWLADSKGESHRKCQGNSRKIAFACEKLQNATHSSLDILYEDAWVKTLKKDTYILIYK